MAITGGTVNGDRAPAPRTSVAPASGSPRWNRWAAIDRHAPGTATKMSCRLAVATRLSASHPAEDARLRGRKYPIHIDLYLVPTVRDPGTLLARWLSTAETSVNRPRPRCPVCSTRVRDARAHVCQRKERGRMRGFEQS